MFSRFDLIGLHGVAPDPDHPSNLATIRPDGSDLDYLTDNTDPAVHLLPGSYSPNGKYIVYDSRTIAGIAPR